MRIVAIVIMMTLIFSGCSSTRVNAGSYGKHHGVGVKTNVLKF